MVRRMNLIDSATLGLPDFEPGHVWLVGAGPGDPGLLSALALHALARADAVVYDALVDPRILRLARAGAVLDFAGKRGGRPSPGQPDISARLIRFAREGKKVLRLKGGDPCVFGRGGEEAAALAAAGVPFRIVPGITAGIGGLAYAGIPLTHRDTNSAVTFLTGHDSDGSAHGGLDWQAIARGAPVLYSTWPCSSCPRSSSGWWPVGQTGGAGGGHHQGDHCCPAGAGLEHWRGRHSFRRERDASHHRHRRSRAIPQSAQLGERPSPRPSSRERENEGPADPRIKSSEEDEGQRPDTRSASDRAGWCGCCGR